MQMKDYREINFKMKTMNIMQYNVVNIKYTSLV